MSVIHKEYLTVAKAADLLGVSQSTLWRWIKQGYLPTYRFGYRRVLVKQVDLDKLIRPSGGEKRDTMLKREREQLARPLSRDEQKRALAALAAAREAQEQLLERRSGKPFPSSWEDLDKARAERTRQLQ